MLRKLFVFIVLLSGISSLTYAQSKKTAIVKGRLLNSNTKAPFHDLKVTIPDLNVFTTSDENGNFSISEVPYGEQTIIISSYSAKSDTIKFMVNKNLVNLKDIYITQSDRGISPENSEIPTIPIEYNTSNDDENSSSSSQSSGGMFVAGDDPFLYTMANFYNQYHFRPRGFDNIELQVNGINIGDLERGNWSWSQFGGLNDVLHSRNVTYGLKPSSYAYGGINGSIYVDATAADQRKGTTATYTLTNRNYRDRIMLTHNSGLMKNGWAYSVSASRRWANEGYIPGTFYDGYSFYGAVSKVINKGQFNLTAIGAPTKRGGSSFAETDEAYDLAKNNQYNPYWGYQNGKIRDSKVTNVFQPVIIANYTYSPSDRTRWNTSVGYEFGKYKSSGIDYYNAYSPLPDYYRNFPSYYANFNPPNLTEATAIQSQLQSHPEQMQINWDELYNSNYINYETIKNVNGIVGNNVTGKRSLYVLSNYVDDQKTLSFNTNIEHNQNEHLTLYGGVKFASQQDEYYKQLADLLGGDFYVNYNQFATQTTIGNPNYNQNNLNNPNQLIKVGDKYGYDYIGKIKQGDAWGQATFVYNKIDFFAAANFGGTSFSRDGLMKNGLFPDNSYGESPSHNFLTYKVKGGITYKIDLRNFIYLNADYSVEAPSVANTYISAATRDFTVSNPTTFKAKTIECGYLLKSSIFNARITGYVTDLTDVTTIARFYNDDPSILSYVNYVMKNVNIRSIGTEISGTYKLDKVWSLTGVAATGQTFFTNTPTVSIYQDNDPTLTAIARKVYIKDYYVAVGPQSIYSMGVNYRPRNSWHANINFNYLDRNFVSINPDRRTQQATDLVNPSSAQWKQIVDQEELPGAFTVDLNAGKSFNVNNIYKKLHHKTTLNFSMGIANLLNNQNIKVAGYEQLRFDYTYHNPAKFPNKYDYAYGINFYANLSLRF